MATKSTSPATTQATPRLKQLYNQEFRSQLQKELGLANVHQVPKMQKVVVSVGLGRGKDEKRLFEAATTTLSKITGQHPIQTLARKSIASFKLREGQPVGLKVTLRGDKMYEFVDRLIQIVLPRLRDFHGVSDTAFDAGGNYNLGFVDQSVFPELSFGETTVTHGVQVTIITNSGNPEHAKSLLSKFGMPFERKQKEQ